MKRIIISAAVFAIGFIATYLIMSFGIGGLMIKLDAAPVEYFFASLAHLSFFKCLISIPVGLIAGVITLISLKKK